MKINQAGLRLIKKYEGFRSIAYRDAVGVWTIGYGHTSMAGSPHVSKGLKITRQQGEQMLATDIEKFSHQIRPLIKVKLTDNQFSALVSFAYNVGVGNFKRSSVLRAVNARRFDRVPSRLSLWVKAGGKTLKGLVRRRASEGNLFARQTNIVRKTTRHHSVKPVSGKPVLKSTTNLAAFFSAMAGIVSSILSTMQSDGGRVVMLLLTAIIIAASIWIIRERIIKSHSEGV